jgi:hypothetical protein
MREPGCVSLAGSLAASLKLSPAMSLAASSVSFVVVAGMPLLVRDLTPWAWCDICCGSGVWS